MQPNHHTSKRLPVSSIHMTVIISTQELEANVNWKASYLKWQWGGKVHCKGRKESDVIIGQPADLPLRTLLF